MFFDLEKKRKKQEAKLFKIDNKYDLVAQDINFFFTEESDEKKQVLKDFNYSFLKNKIYSIIGPSGSGKSTLISHFNGLLKSKTANIFLFNGSKILFYKKKIKNFKTLRKAVGMVLQFPEYQLFQSTVFKDVCYGPKILGFPKNEVLLKASEYLISLGLGPEFFNVSPFNLSGGQKRKAALAGILAIDPQILIFDEPTVGLDPASEAEIIELIKELKNEGKTIIIISHNMDLILQLTDIILLLDKGKLITTGVPYSIFNNDELVNKLNFVKPMIIDLINDLIKENNKFKVLLNIAPKNMDELVNSIKKIIFND